ncbi:MAG TPA: copper-containing nitrite reductase [Puia sp.]|uniref:copper-containing nitrite reductase n=1 Tax=Puia sp. TaxID=2045100 RepID=UPI002CFC8308|nr:copper-containing nitrite reductase [Puia sp.]HVU94319.1 copper-containing nitrite reductase [Puia sp.]
MKKIFNDPNPPKALLIVALAGFSCWTIFALTGCNQAGATAAKAFNDTAAANGYYTAELTRAPLVPAARDYDEPKKVIVNLEVVEKVMKLADGVDYTYWTFGGSVPGPFIRVRQGDEVELHLSNDPNNKMPHNIDLHAVNGPGGGAEATLTVPGHTSVFSFRPLNSGLYVYHCATAPVGMHIANGMYGLILVTPHEGLPKVDKEFYLMQGEFYTKGKNGEPGLQPFDMDKAIKEQPEYVVFNGSVGAASGANALRAKVGDRVRIYVGNGGPNLVSSFHVIGQIFDKVYEEGGTQVHQNIGTTLIPSGGAAIVEFLCREPGTYSIVDHSIFRAFNQGAIAQLVVTGKADKIVYSGKIKDELFQPGASDAVASDEPTEAPTPELPLADRYKKGQLLFETNCSSCHQPTGLGLPGAIPPLAKSDFLMGRGDKGIGILLHGINNEPITVNGKKFQGVMPQLPLGDDQVANILSYVRNSWGNKSPVIQEKEVKKFRNQ